MTIEETLRAIVREELRPVEIELSLVASSKSQAQLRNADLIVIACDPL